MINALEKPIRWLAQTSAMLGGIVLLLVMIMTVISVAGMSLHKLGRYLKKTYEMEIGPLLAVGPIPGETELIEVGMAFIIFAFMPIVTLNRGHASVEILTNAFSATINRLIDLAADLLLLAAAGYLGYRHYLGMLDKYGNGETTWILQFPLWWGYGGAMFGAVVFVIICTFCVLRSFNHLLAGTSRQASEILH